MKMPVYTTVILLVTRSYAALRAADLDWIIMIGYSLGGHILGCSERLALCLRHSARIGPNLLCHPSSIIRRPSSTVRHPSSVIRHPPSVIRHPPSVIRHPPFVIRRLSSVILHSSFVIRHPPSFIRHLSSVVCHQSSVIRTLLYFFVSFHHFFRTFSLFSPIFCKIENIFLKNQKFKNKFLLARAIHREHFLVTMLLRLLCCCIPHICHGSHGYTRVNFFWNL